MTIVTTLHVEGITGIDDVARVRSALDALPGAEEVIVELRAAAPAHVTVLSHVPMDDAALRAAVTGAELVVVAVAVAVDAEASERAAQSGAMQSAHDSAAHAGTGTAAHAGNG